MKKETLLRILRKHLNVKFDKATWAEWIKTEPTMASPRNYWAMLPERVNMGKLADEIMTKLVGEKFK